MHLEMFMILMCDPVTGKGACALLFTDSEHIEKSA